MQENYENIYDNLKKNSIGREKKCDYKKEIKKIVLKISVAALTATLLISFLVSCRLKKYDPQIKNETSQSQKDELSNYNGYELDEIMTYSHIRFSDLIKKYNVGYTFENEKIKLNYVTEDLKKIPELDDTYLFEFYDCLTDESFLAVLKLFGYISLEEFLIKNNYINSDGTGNIHKWFIGTCSKISEEMAEKGMEGRNKKGWSK